MCYSKFSGAYSSRMPVIRVYGTTTTGQKICVNVHGVLPYFFVELPAVESDVENFIRDFVFSLEKSIRSKLSTPYMREMYIFDASVVSGVSIYGYHDSAKPFIKLYLIDPALVSTCSELLQSGAILNRAFQTYETHIPYLLQFCVDYNLYGMNLLYAGYFKFRVSNYIGFPSLLKKSEDLWSPSKFNSKYFLSSNSAPKCTSMELEVDISAWDILNRRDLQDNLSLNPGLEAMWTEEEMRRASRTNQSEKLPDLPTADELLPVEQDIGVDLSGSEIHYLSQWVDLLHQYAAPPMQQDNDVTFTESSTPNDDYISKWLECSHTDDEDADEEIENYKDDHTIEATDDRIPVLQLTQEPIVLKTFIDNNTTTNSITSSSSSSIPQPTRSKSVSSFTTISSTGLQELYRLASATEEFDAWVPSTEQLDQLHNHLDNVSKMHCSLDATTLRHSQLLTNDADWTNSSPINTVEKEILNHGFNNNSIASQISILQPSQTTKKSIEQDGHEGHNDDDDEDEATLITNATQYALSFVCNQLSITNELTVGGNLLATVNKTIEDDEYMSQPAGGDLNEHIAKLSVDQNTNESSVSYDWDEISDDLFNSIDYLTSQELKSISEISGEDDEEDDDNVFHQHSTPVQIEKIKAEKILPTKDDVHFLTHLHF
ncbi:unnamed protein product [Heterobilharzia americana]|nr:unnamed protein product [Heterobilharzia americana]